MLALDHLYLGKVDPAKLSPQWNYPSAAVRPDAGRPSCCGQVAAGAIRESFERARPQHAWYERGRERLREYYALRDAGGWSRLAAGPMMQPGSQRSARAGAAAASRGDRRPRVAGGAGAAAYEAPLPPYDTTYDAELEAAVKRFQDRHGLTADGVIGPGTLAALNVPVSARIDQLRVNMERARWVMHELKGDFVLVDVAGFDVSWFRDDEPVWTSKVIVGRPYRETPIFKSLITYVVFNPTWTIPPGILVKDKLPILKKDPGYLKRNHIRVIDSRGREGRPGFGQLEGVWRRTAAALPAPAGSGRRQCARTGQDHVPEPVLGVPARHADEVAVRQGRAHVQLGLHPGAEGVRAGGTGAERPGALERRRHRRSRGSEGDEDRESRERRCRC